jgi:hypothetical protein
MNTHENSLSAFLRHPMRNYGILTFSLNYLYHTKCEPGEDGLGHVDEVLQIIGKEVNGQCIGTSVGGSVRIGEQDIHWHAGYANFKRSLRDLPQKYMKVPFLFLCHEKDVGL